MRGHPMRGHDPRPPGRRGAAARGWMWFAFLVLACIAVASVGAPSVLADGTLTVDPSHGPATAKVNASYVFVDPTGAGACPPSVTFLWDGAPVSPSIAPRPDCANSPTTYSFLPPSPATTTTHRVTACYYLRNTCLAYAGIA